MLFRSLTTVTAQAAEHRQGAEHPFAGSPDSLPAHLEAVEQHRADAARLANEAETLSRQIRVAEQLLNRLESEQAEREAAATQAIGRKLLAAALERYTLAAAELGDAVLNMGAAAILAGQPSSFAACMRAMLLPDLLALGAALPALPGFRRQREGQTVATADPAFSQRASELLRDAP